MRAALLVTFVACHADPEAAPRAVPAARHVDVEAAVPIDAPAIGHGALTPIASDEQTITGLTLMDRAKLDELGAAGHPPCGPLQIIYDHENLVTVTAPLAYRTEGSPEIDFWISNKPRTCAEVLNDSMPIARDELLVQVSIRRDPNTPWPDIVGWDNDTQDLKLKADVVPKQAGDRATTCLPDAVLHGKMRFGGHSLEARGLVNARYCGTSRR